MQAHASEWQIAKKGGGGGGGDHKLRSQKVSVFLRGKGFASPGVENVENAPEKGLGQQIGGGEQRKQLSPSFC